MGRISEILLSYFPFRYVIIFVYLGVGVLFSSFDMPGLFYFFTILGGWCFLKLVLWGFLNMFPQVIFKGFHTDVLNWFRMLLSLRIVLFPWNRMLVYRRSYSIDSVFEQTEDCINKLYGIALNHHRRNMSVRTGFTTGNRIWFVNYTENLHNFGSFVEMGPKLSCNRYNFKKCSSLYPTYSYVETVIELDFKKRIVKHTIYLKGNDESYVNSYEIPKGVWFIYELFPFIGGDEPARSKIKIGN